METIIDKSRKGRYLFLMSNRVVLTISVLISNRPDTVRKCLDSIRPLLAKVSSELILVDTGCGEQVRGIIEEYTDNIVDFKWCRDFAKARNAGLERAGGEWFLYLDDDEWFEDVTDIIRFFRSGEYRIYGVGLYTVRDYVRTDGSQYSDSLVARLIRLEPDIRFIYRIHESFNRAPGKAKRLNAFVHHYGYAFQTREEAREHAARNIGLLQEELAEHPCNMRHTLQLAQEYNVLGEIDKSLELSLEAIDRAEREAVEEEYCLSSLYGNVINGYMATYQYDEAISKGEVYMKSSRTDRMVKALIAGRLAMAFVDKEAYDKALDYGKAYWATYQMYQKNRDAFMGFETPVTQSCFNRQKRTPILGSGVRAAVRCGKAELAWEWFQAMDWELEKYSLDFGVIRDILKYMAEADSRDLPYYDKMCNVLLERPDLESTVLETIMKCCSSREADNSEICGSEKECDSSGIEEKQIRAISAYAGLKADHWFVKLSGLTAAAFRPRRGICCNAEEAEAMALEIWEAGEESMEYMKACHMPEAVRLLGGDMGHVLEMLPFSRWERQLGEYFGRYTWRDTVWLAEALEAAGEQDSMHMLAWRAACGISRASAEAAAMERGEERYGSAEDMMRGLEEYALCRMALCGKIYREEVIQSMQDVLPEEYRGAFAIRDLLEKTETKAYAEAVEAVREIKNLLPGLANIMKHYLIWLEEQLKRQKRESVQAAGEFQALAGQIKAKVYALAEAGQYQAALGVAEQLHALLPEDEEINQLRNKLMQTNF